MIGWLLRSIKGNSKTSERIETQLEFERNERERLKREYDSLRIDFTKLSEAKAVAETKLLENEKRFIAQQEFITSAEARMLDSFKVLSGESLKSSSGEFLKQAESTLGDRLVKPLHESLKRYEEQIKNLESKRDTEYGGLRNELETLTKQNKDLQIGTERLVSALKRPEVRGSWGESQVENILKLSGASELCDFQKQITTDDGSGRVDFIIHHRLSGQKLIIDSKVNLGPFLESSALSDKSQETMLTRHAESVKKNMIDLSKKEYWNKIENALDFVIMFVPSESLLYSALSEDASLLEDALAKKVVIASPMTLIVLMRLLVIGWQKYELEKNVMEILNQTKELYNRFKPFIDNLENTGKHLDAAIESYNKTIGSYERNIFTSLQRVKELSPGLEQHSEPSQITQTARLIVKKIPS